MTKKQNRARGFGKRSLSVVLAVLLLMSTLAVMLSVTSLTASASISYWNVAGDFNDWGNSLNNSAYRINGGSGSVTVNISSDTYSSIKFKMCAYEDGWKWCGNSSGSATVNSETELSWNSGNDIQLSLPSGTTQVTFKIEVKSGKNYLTVTANGSSGGGSDESQMRYTAPVNKSNSANTADNLFWATATYFDYESDRELVDGWLKPVQAGTHNFNGAQDEWYPFYCFNREVVKAQADAHDDWNEPMYFGNFCDTSNAYDSAHHQGGTDTYGYREATSSYNTTRFKHIVNNSGVSWDSSVPHVADDHTSYQGLVNSQLSSSGDLLLPNGQQAPYFDASEDTPLNGYAKIVNSSFPFKVTEITDSTTNKKYKKYTFNSKNATDNVYFTWATDGSTTYPTGVNYGAGTTYGVLDGVSRFMNNTASGYGIFPFNNASNNYKGTKTNANENLNYGFGIKTQVKFRVPKKGETGNTANNHTKFSFSGDDDLWMYITDDQGNSQLLLDMGGDHKESTGEVDFYNLTAKVDKVGTGGGSTTKSFAFDYNKTYTMTVFYMERGLIESNCKMEFTMTPLGNNFIVTEEIDTVNVNAGLQDAVRQLSTFGFVPYNNGSELPEHSGYSDFELGDGENEQIPDSVLEINSNVKVQQYAPQNSYLTYDTEWDYYDTVSGTRLGHGTGVTSNGVTTTTCEETIINESGNEYDFAELRVDYRNTPQIGSFSVTKSIADGDEGFEDEEFDATIYLQFKKTPTSGAPDQYEQMSAYTLVDTAGNEVTDGKITLKPGEVRTFEGIPIGTRVYVEEDLDTMSPDFEFDSYNHPSTDPFIVGSDPVAGDPADIIVTNKLIMPEALMGDLQGMTKQLNGKEYSGDMFLFKLEGVNTGLAGDVDTSGMTPLQTNDVSDGLFSFEGLQFDREGTYRYRMYEDTSHLALLDAGNLFETSFATDFEDDGNSYLVKIEVTRTGATLHKSNPVYYSYSGSGPVVAADFSNDKIANSVIFRNTMMNGNIKVQKLDQNNEPVDGVTFQVIKVDSYISGLTGTDAEIYDAVRSYVRTHRNLVAGGGTTGEDATDGTPGEEGYAQIRNLSIYADSFITTTSTSIEIENDAPAYQEYILIETDVPYGYAINKTVNRFSFPINGQYDFTFSEDQAYVNGMIKNPAAGGIKGILFAGFGIVALATVLLLAYVLFNKKRSYVPTRIKK